MKRNVETIDGWTLTNRVEEDVFLDEDTPTKFIVGEMWKRAPYILMIDLDPSRTYGAKRSIRGGLQARVGDGSSWVVLNLENGYDVAGERDQAIAWANLYLAMENPDDIWGADPLDVWEKAGERIRQPGPTVPTKGDVDTINAHRRSLGMSKLDPSDWSPKEIADMASSIRKHGRMVPNPAAAKRRLMR